MALDSLHGTDYADDQSYGCRKRVVIAGLAVWDEAVHAGQRLGAHVM